MSARTITIDLDHLYDEMESYFVQRTRCEMGYALLDHIYDLGGIHILEMLHLIPEEACTELRKICEMGFESSHAMESTDDDEDWFTEFDFKEDTI